MTKNYLFVCFLLIVFINSCKKEEPVIDEFLVDEISGYVQKGPYLNGTSITVTELSPELIPTGKIYSSQLVDNKGTFELREINLSSQYVELMASGFYFNEVKNSNSEAQLTLYALSDLSNKSSLNVNIISNLERSRVKYLLDNGMEFAEAKQLAQREILAIFEIEKSDILESEKLDITQSGEDNAILLAISAILQGNLSVADLSELLANIGTDIREDGTLDNESLGTVLINNARLLQSDIIRQNLENRYRAMSIDVDLPDFEKYIRDFIENTSYEYTVSIEYPETGIFGKNLLAMEGGEIIQARYSLTADLSEKTNLLVKMNGQGFYLNNNPYDVSNIGWDIIDQTGIYASARTGKIELEILLEAAIADTMVNEPPSQHMFSLEVYENGSTYPNFNRQFTIVREE